MEDELNDSQMYDLKEGLKEYDNKIFDEIPFHIHFDS